MVFDNGRLVEENMDVDALRLIIADKGLHVWIDLENPTPEESRLVLEDMFQFHPLAIEDCIQESSLPKVDDYEDYVFLVMHAVSFNRQDLFSAIECNLFIGREFLVTYHVEPMRSISVTMEKCRKMQMGIAKAPDRLVHAILDMMVNNYNQVLDELSLELQEVEDNIFTVEEKDLMSSILRAKRELETLSQTIRPQRDVIGRLGMGELKVIRSPALPYYRDIHGHLQKIDGQISSYKEQLFLTMDVYLNKVANKTNDIIRVLTILTAVTTPIMIVGTWYGMNFDGMPELHSRSGYFTAMVVTLVSTAGIIGWMKWKKYI
ncbi:MAG: magnesium/cobalt transporter CorA [Verrucomicrobiae bacterium]|nr:magnesium/cobalt transporter CorA [Verrucomicrobiae bacterium]